MTTLTKQYIEAEIKDGWFREAGVDTETHAFRFKEILYDGDTAFQHATILDTHEFGKMLVIDGLSQSAQLDEYIYHEALVQPAMALHPNPKRVLILGGGEGATLREVLRHKTVEEVVMIDIDEQLVNLCQKLLPEWHRGSFNDPRARIEFTDAFAWLDHNPERFDVIIVDLCDEEDESVGHLYTDAFYRSVKNHLNENGITVIQAMEILPYRIEAHLAIRNDLKTMLPDVYSYYTFVSSFWSNWSFVLAGNIDKSRMTSAAIDRILQERGVQDQLRFYDGITQQRIFSLSKDIREKLA